MAERLTQASRIVAASWAVLERSGFRTLKVRQVMAASGISANVFYRHFPSKAQLLLALMDAEMSRAMAQAEVSMAAESTATGRVRAWVANNVALVFDEGRAQRARLFLDPELAAELPTEVARIIEGVIAPLMDAIRDGLEGGEFHSVDVEADARSVYQLMRGFTLDHFAGQISVTEAEAVDLVTGFVLRALHRS